ncbi:class I SAM-dependent methyltransferase [Paenibacillus larvae]|uniref:class I SAM-dependent methyltransferase n=1 Tax=Paenibacillus larvae TaxID=1464 RepID=UPI002405E044|nr:class I SAM-dependent methyltransferase [Paenibacillus larvae]
MSTWFKESFGKDYLIVYKHRDLQGAYHEVKNMMEWLQLPQESEVLDLCCGMGRHSVALADFGFKVTGLDLSVVLLGEAKKLDKDNKVEWIHADMKEIPLERKFDDVVNLFTLFGYFEKDEDNFKVLSELSRLLIPNGKFIVDFLNPPYVAEHLVPYSERFQGDMLIEESRSIEEGFVRKRIVIKEPGEANRHYLEQVKLYDYDWFEDAFHKVGLEVEQVYGTYENNVYVPGKSPRMIFVGHKKG